MATLSLCLEPLPFPVGTRRRSASYLAKSSGIDTRGGRMSYTRFGCMIAVSTVVMFGLMYLNTYSIGHVWFSQTRAWMAMLMGGAMALVMLAFMIDMYPSRVANAA